MKAQGWEMNSMGCGNKTMACFFYSWLAPLVPANLTAAQGCFLKKQGREMKAQPCAKKIRQFGGKTR
jgi:hypothetical protein